MPTRVLLSTHYSMALHVPIKPGFCVPILPQVYTRKTDAFLIFDGGNHMWINFLHYFNHFGLTVSSSIGTYHNILLEQHTVWMRKLRFEELKFSCHVVNEESTPVNLKGTAEGKIFWEKKIFYFLVFLNAFKALSFTCSRTQSRHCCRCRSSVHKVNPSLFIIFAKCNENSSYYLNYFCQM